MIEHFFYALVTIGCAIGLVLFHSNANPPFWNCVFGAGFVFLAYLGIAELRFVAHKAFQSPRP